MVNSAIRSILTKPSKKASSFYAERPVETQGVYVLIDQEGRADDLLKAAPAMKVGEKYQDSARRSLEREGTHHEHYSRCRDFRGKDALSAVAAMQGFIMFIITSNYRRIRLL